MGASIKINNKVYFIGGIRLANSQGGVEELNDRIVIYDIDLNEWEVSEQFIGENAILYERISPFAFYNENDNTIRVSGGAVPVGEGQNQEITFLTDTYKINIATLEIERDEQDYIDIPMPRYKGGTSVIQNTAYFLGGATRKANVSKTFESIDASVSLDPFDFNELAEIETPKQAFGITSDQFRYIYVAGGITSGRPAGFLQINATVTPDTIKLDGKQSAGVDIELVDEVGDNPTNDIRILVRGFVVFSGGADVADDLQGGGGGSDDAQQNASDNVNRSALIYPVVFSSNDITAVNGFASTTLLPRSEDILDKVDEIRKKIDLARMGNNTDSAEENDPIVINEGDVRNPYIIRVQIIFIDDF